MEDGAPIPTIPSAVVWILGLALISEGLRFLISWVLLYQTTWFRDQAAQYHRLTQQLHSKRAFSKPAHRRRLAEDRRETLRRMNWRLVPSAVFGMGIITLIISRMLFVWYSGRAVVLLPFTPPPPLSLLTHLRLPGRDYRHGSHFFVQLLTFFLVRSGSSRLTRPFMRGVPLNVRNLVPKRSFQRSFGS